MPDVDVLADRIEELVARLEVVEARMVELLASHLDLKKGVERVAQYQGVLHELHRKEW